MKWTKKRRAFLIVVAIILVVFDVSFAVMKHLGNEAYAQQQEKSKVAIEKMDKQIADITAKKKAEKAAAQKAASDEALSEQLQGAVVTPAGCANTGAHANPDTITVVINKKHCSKWSFFID